ncbi:MAG: transporter substrate-binding domain-containing protein [Magnetovibrionaceae bacterium]
MIRSALHALFLFALTALGFVFSTGNALAQAEGGGRNAGILTAGFDQILDRGLLKVGVKADYPPYGFRDEKGEIIGLEVDLARNLAERMGLEVEFTPVTASDRISALQEGRIDLILATMTDRPDRRKAVRIIEPNYYASGTNVLAPDQPGLGRWRDLADQTVCGIEGAFYNRMMERDYGARMKTFERTPDVYEALRSGECIAFVYDDSAIIGQLSLDIWQGYGMPLPTINEAPWGIGIRHGDPKLAELLGETVADWHRSGLILELERKWGLQETGFALKMHERYLYR